MLTSVAHPYPHPSLSAAAKLLDDANPDAPRSAEQIQAAAETAGDAATHACHIGALVGFALSLKAQLKRQYGLSDVRCSIFDPTEAAKGPERPIARLNDVMSLDTSRAWQLPRPSPSLPASALPPSKRGRRGSTGGGGVEPAAAPTGGGDAARLASGAALSAAQYCWLRSLMADDEAEVDFNIVASPKDKDTGGAGARSGSAGGGGGAVRSAPRKRALATGGGGAKGGTPGSKRSGGSSGRVASARRAKGASAKWRKKAESSEDEDSPSDMDDDDDFRG